MKNCAHQKTDNKGLLNCTRGDSHIGLCQLPCPYKATSSATMTKYHTFRNKQFSRQFRRKRRRKSSVPQFSNVLHPVIEADGVE
ncbi:hypothetical protein KEJ45_00030 [Candidatus Bathyarchaeota archaeon]|nr:hypothetical protein [Candidatus Bathyarchaeota archaeon]